MSCPNCYRDNIDGAVFCCACGHRLHSQAPSVSASAGIRPSATQLLLGLCLVLIAVIAYKLLYLGSAPTLSKTYEYGVEDLVVEGGPYVEALMESNSKSVRYAVDKERYAAMNQREIIQNRSLPKLLGPYIKLRSVNYKHSKREMDYQFYVGRSFALAEFGQINHILQGRYCSDSEFSMHRNYGVRVNWIYWGGEGVLKHRYSSKDCRSGKYLLGTAQKNPQSEMY